MRALRHLATAVLFGVPVLTAAAAPSQAQGLFDFLLGRPVVPAPSYTPYYDYPPAPRVRRVHRPRRIVRTEPRELLHRVKRIVRAEPPVRPKPAGPIKAKPMGEVTNPVPQLMADSTLRRGDIVVFPDGPRVFIGDQGSRHSLPDFRPASQAGKVVPASTRKLLAKVEPATNAAWSTDTLNSGKLAANAKDVESTGSTGTGRR